MSRPLRLEFPGALYHVTSRGDRRASIFFDDNDRRAWLDVLALVCARCHFVVYAFCQMPNHYHLMVETVEGNLSQGMRQLNGIYTQKFNRRHGMAGHVLQGRYKAILVQKDSYLRELARYIVLNPVRAGLAAAPEDWRWSSHRAMCGSVDAPAWLETAWLHSQFGKSAEFASLAYQQFVRAGMDAKNPLKAVSHQLILGDEQFIADHGGRHGAADMRAVPKVQRRVTAQPLEYYFATYSSRDEAMARAYQSTAFTMAEIARHIGVGYSTVSRAVVRFEHHPAAPLEP